MNFFEVFVVCVRPLGSQDPWKRRYVAAQCRNQVIRAMILEGVEVRSRSMYVARSFYPGQGEVFEGIDGLMKSSVEQVLYWRSVGFRYLLWRKGELVLYPVQEIQDGEDRVIYDLDIPHDYFLGAIRFAHHCFVRKTASRPLTATG